MTIENSDLRELDATIHKDQNRVIDLLQELVNAFKQQNEFNQQAIELIKAMESIKYGIPENKPITDKNIKAPEPNQTGQVSEEEKKDGFYQ